MKTANKTTLMISVFPFAVFSFVTFGYVVHVFMCVFSCDFHV